MIILRVGDHEICSDTGELHVLPLLHATWLTSRFRFHTGQLRHRPDPDQHLDVRAACGVHVHAAEVLRVLLLRDLSVHHSDRLPRRHDLADLQRLPHALRQCGEIRRCLLATQG